MNRFFILIVIVLITLTGAIAISDTNQTYYQVLTKSQVVKTDSNILTNQSSEKGDTLFTNDSDDRSNNKENDQEIREQVEQNFYEQKDEVSSNDEDLAKSEDLDKTNQGHVDESSTQESLFSAIRAGDYEEVETLLSETTDFDVNRDYRESRPLIQAVRLDEMRIATLLIEVGADPNLPSPSVNYTPLEAAFDTDPDGNEKPDHAIYDLTNLLLKNGADPDTIFVDGRSALEVAEDKELHFVRGLLNDYREETDEIEDNDTVRVFDTYEKRAQLAKFIESVQIGDDERIVSDYIGQGTVYQEDERFTLYGPFPSKFITQDGKVKLISWGRLALFDQIPGSDTFYEWKTDEGVGPYDTYQAVAEAYGEYDYKFLYKQGDELPNYLIIEKDHYLLVFVFREGKISSVFECSPEMLEVDIVKNSTFTFDRLEEQPF